MGWPVIAVLNQQSAISNQQSANYKVIHNYHGWPNSGSMANHNAGAVEVSDTIVHSTKIKTLQYITDQPMAQPAKNAMVS